jgi:hypothetical protein
MIHTTHKDEKTEDGDISRWTTITCDTFKEAAEVTKDMKNLVNAFGHFPYKDMVWKGKGGCLVYSYHILIDATEMAIEKANDEWASRIAASEPDWAH